MRLFYSPEDFRYFNGNLIVSGVLKTGATREYISYDDKTRYIYDSHLATVNGQFDASTDSEIITQVLFNRLISEGNTIMKVRPPDFTDLIKHRELNHNVLSEINRDYVPIEGPKNAITIPADTEFPFLFSINFANMYNRNNSKEILPLKFSEIGESNSLITHTSSKEISHLFINQYNDYYFKFLRDNKLHSHPKAETKIATDADVESSLAELASEGFFSNTNVQATKILEQENYIYQDILNRKLDLAICSQLFGQISDALAQNQCSSYLPGVISILGNLIRQPGMKCYLVVMFYGMLQSGFSIALFKDLKKMIDKKILNDLKLNFKDLFKKYGEFIVIKTNSITFNVPRLNKESLNKLTITKVCVLLFFACNVIQIIFS